ncbi:MAG TPA: isochorismatase family protein [Actinomycetes bacterium]|jgi:nicotinamidase-related amidase|nr:isochorismatase family protein [Actinomycetes bacterium]
MPGKHDSALRGVGWWASAFSEEEREIYQRSRRHRDGRFPLAESALLVVDVTHAFLGPRLPTIEACRSVRTACGLPGWEALDRIEVLVRGFRSSGRRVVFTKPDWPEERHFGGTTVGRPDVWAEEDQIPDRIAPRQDELVLRKPKASAFFATALLTFLNRHAVRGLVLAGSTTSGCVRASVVDASSYGFPVLVAHDACFDRSQLSHAVSLQELDAKYATVTDVDAILAALADG